MFSFDLKQALFFNFQLYEMKIKDQNLLFPIYPVNVFLMLLHNFQLFQMLATLDIKRLITACYVTNDFIFLISLYKLFLYEI